MDQILKTEMFENARKGITNLHHKLESTGTTILLKGQKWFQLTPAAPKDCDIILVFPSGSSEELRSWLVHLLNERVPELKVTLKHHKKLNQYALYLTANYKNLLIGAEALSLRKRLNVELGGGFRAFQMEELDLFQDATDEDIFLTSQERQRIVKYWLFSLKAKGDDTFEHVKFLENQSIVPILLSEQLVSQVFPLHNKEDLKKLRTSWVSAVLHRQPLDEIESYFGVKIALYFAWLGHYTVALIFPTLIGIIGWKLTYQENQDIYYMVTSLFNLLWATIYLEHWKRTSSELTYRWGTLDYHSHLYEEPRPLFRGTPSLCPITGRIIRTYPEWKRQVIIYLVTAPLIALCLAIVVLITYVLAETQTWVDEVKIAQGDWPRFVTHIPKVTLAVSIGLLDDLYKRIAFWLNHLENHRLEESNKQHLIVKLVLFQFMNSFFSLFYIAFYLQDLNRLKEQLATLVIVRQFIGNAKEILIPFATAKFRQVSYGIQYERQQRLLENQDSTPISAETVQTIGEEPGSSTEVHSDTQQLSTDDTDVTCSSGDGVKERNVDKDVNTKKESAETSKADEFFNMLIMSQAEEESILPKYDDPYEDYLEMFIQFGYVSMFACAFPLAGLFCLANNIMEIRSDAFKLTTTYQRNFGQKVPTIGVWQLALEVLSCVAVSVNIALLGVSGALQRILPGITSCQSILILVALEHIFISLKFAIAYAIPDIPQWVEQEIAKKEHKRREALKMFEKEALRERRRHRSGSKSSSESRDVSRGRHVSRRSTEKLDAGLSLSEADDSDVGPVATCQFSEF